MPPFSSPSSLKAAVFRNGGRHPCRRGFYLSPGGSFPRRTAIHGTHPSGMTAENGGFPSDGIRTRACPCLESKLLNPSDLSSPSARGLARRASGRLSPERAGVRLCVATCTPPGRRRRAVPDRTGPCGSPGSSPSVRTAAGQFCFSRFAVGPLPVHFRGTGPSGRIHVTGRVTSIRHVSFPADRSFGPAPSLPCLQGARVASFPPFPPDSPCRVPPADRVFATTPSSRDGLSCRAVQAPGARASSRFSTRPAKRPVVCQAESPTSPSRDGPPLVDSRRTFPVRERSPGVS